MLPTISIWIWSVGWASVLSGFPGSSYYGEETIRVSVLTILATDRNTDIDPRLKCIAEEVQKTDPQLTGFQLGPIRSKSAVVGQAQIIPLVDKESAEIMVVHGADKENRVSLKVKPPQMGEIEYTSVCGKFFTIVTRYQTKDKDRLIIAIMVRPCKN